MERVRRAPNYHGAMAQLQICKILVVYRSGSNLICGEEAALQHFVKGPHVLDCLDWKHEPGQLHDGSEAPLPGEDEPRQGGAAQSLHQQEAHRASWNHHVPSDCSLGHESSDQTARGEPRARVQGGTQQVSLFFRLCLLYLCLTFRHTMYDQATVGLENSLSLIYHSGCADGVSLAWHSLMVRDKEGFPSTKLRA